ncbi:GyrI-like domain-containing protein [Flavobacterium sp. YJ01]|uniref:GyrI-like domain-containing protein n=1 Tax=unclassified Flavobacterium TaxID=196869 RepID=UPI0023E431CF|nr:GyrI-like domain-containing protein [Flavobacterium sp. YJ01]WET03832.1 GyrI-like domain-containing protein [Flavobacterium sp. YJ01]
MQPLIKTLTEKKLTGHFIEMSFIENKTFQLWNAFMPKKKEIKNTINSNLYSLEVYPENYFDNFNPSDNFQKWAAVEVSDYEDLPHGMKTLVVSGGLYAVFLHFGPATEAHKTYNYIFAEWLPNSAYIVDERPHFAVMNEKYKKDDPNSEEEIWIPIKNRN